MLLSSVQLLENVSSTLLPLFSTLAQLALLHGEAWVRTGAFFSHVLTGCVLLLPQMCQLALFNFPASGELASRLSGATAAGADNLSR